MVQIRRFVSPNLFTLLVLFVSGGLFIGRFSPVPPLRSSILHLFVAPAIRASASDPPHSRSLSSGALHRQLERGIYIR